MCGCFINVELTGFLI